jgi:hypothetical protein
LLRNHIGEVTAGIKEAALNSKFSPVGFLALALLPLFYGVADITNWQRMAALEKDRKDTKSSAAFKRAFSIYAIESPLIWVFICMFGSIAVVGLTLNQDKDVGNYLQRLVEIKNSTSLVVATLLLATAFAMSLSTINSVFAGSLAALRYDILPSLGSVDLTDSPQFQQRARGQAITFAVLFYVIIVGALYLLERFGKVAFGSSQFLALLFAFYCAQLSFVPLILGPLIHTKSYPHLTLTAGWALAVLACGALAGISSVSIYLVTDIEAWLWAAVPSCIVAGFTVFAAGCAARRNAL